MNPPAEQRSYAPRPSADSYRTNIAGPGSQNETGGYGASGYDNLDVGGRKMSNGNQQMFFGMHSENAKMSSSSLPRTQENAPQDKSKDGPKPSEQKDESQTNGKRGRTQRFCGICGGDLKGQFVRALDSTFHLECFKCRDCGEVVASKFFPVDDEEGNGQYPLCETDYFRRLDLLCFNCGGALRGSYVTALDRKYHIDHFTCSVCPTAFGAKDSYYEHEGRVYCHYHYSTRFAQRCNGCQTAILKQFVEIFRNGQNQHWHPECYMIHKFWNVRLSASEGTDEPLPSEEDASDEERLKVRQEEELMEEKTYRIWSVLSAFEETSAACISDMLLHVSNGALMEGVLVANRFIQHVDVLFGAIDRLDECVASHGMGPLTYGREAKLLCKRIVAFFTLLTKTQDTGVKRLGVTQELLSLVTGLAHYLKLLIRIGLQGALKLEREQSSNEGLNVFLMHLTELEGLKGNEEALDDVSGMSMLADDHSDLCFACQQPIDDECLLAGDRRAHYKHLHCGNCQREIGSAVPANQALYSPPNKQVYCQDCMRKLGVKGELQAVSHVSRLQQYVYLLRVALARLLSVLRSNGNLPHTSDDPNLSNYDSETGHRVAQGSSLERPALTSDSRSKSFGGTPGDQSTYSETVGEIRRLRSTRMDKHLSSTMKQARRSRIMADPAHPGGNYYIEDDNDPASQQRTDLVFNQDALTLDDIPRIAAAEQVKEQRPNAYKHAHSKLIPGTQQPKLLSGQERDFAEEKPEVGMHSERNKRYFAELSALEYFIVRHVAVLQMQPLLEGHYTLEELLSLIELRKQTFWNKFFQKGDKAKAGKKKGVFGVNLEVLIERDSVESEWGLGPGALRVPALLDDAVTAMRQMDLSVEGVFRKNGNIRQLKDMAEKIDKEETVDLSSYSAIQVAALLKKFLREMPEPLMTFKLHDLFTTSQKITDEGKRRRVLHLACCLLPKANRDSLEILLGFLNWAASFSEVDKESGSKMDAHNLATVVAPNILLSDGKTSQTDESFLAIEAVNMLLEYHEQMCMVPDDIQSIMVDTEIFNDMPEATTKEILKRYAKVGEQPERHFGSVKVEAADMPAVRVTDESGSVPSSARSTDAPVATRVDSDLHQYNAWQKESSVRHVQQNGAPQIPPPNHGTPPPFQKEFPSRGSPFHHHRTGSGESGHSFRQNRPAGRGRNNIPVGET